jgi:hypothetical protein
VLGHDPDGSRGSTLFGEAIWSGPADFAQLHASRPVRGLRVHFVSARPAARAASSWPLATPILHAGPGQPPIIARRAWADDQAPPSVRPSYGTIKLAFVHHSESPNGYSAGDVPAILLSIFDYHRYTRGLHDIAYNFAIDAYGRIWEARAGGIDRPVFGAHAGAYNAESTGVVVLGSFMDVPPSGAAIDALERFLAWKLSLHGLPTRGEVTVVVNPSDAFYTPFAPGAHVSLPRIAGHRDGDSTNCPGDAFYARLPAVRALAHKLAGTPAHVNLIPPSAATAGMPTRLSGRLTHLGGKPISGARVEVQHLQPVGEPTLAAATSAADGSWHAAVLLEHNTLVRALHRRRPAVVSGLVEIAVSPAIAVSVQASSLLEVQGTVSPAKRSVKIDLYALSGRHRHLVASKRLVVRRGRFGGSLARPRPGRYDLVARTNGDAVNAAGASPPLQLVV